MKKKKGFSLIELLAVIVVLAILAMIVIPVIGGIIRATRIRAAVSSAYGYIEAANNEIVLKNTKGERVPETTYDVVANLINVKYKGAGPTSGWYTVDKIRVTEGEFCIQGFDIKYENGVASYDKDLDICPKPEEPINYGDPLNELCTDNKNPDRDKKYKIETVEDLVCLSKKVNSGTDFDGEL